MIDRVVKINHVNETYINHIEDDISFIGFHFYQKVQNIMYGPLKRMNERKRFYVRGQLADRQPG